MENNKYIPSIEELIKKTEDFNKKHPEYNYGIDITLIQQVIDVLNFSKDFVEYLYNNGAQDDFELSYVIYGQVVHYMKYCYDNGDYYEIEDMLKFVDKKMQSEDEDINTLAQVGVLENLDMYPDILPKVLELMPKYSKNIFMKHYSHYLKLKK